MDAAQKAEEAKSRLNSWVAISVALLATFMGICSVKDDNIVQGMQQAQADKIDHWAFYQARNIREEVMTSTAVELETARAAAKTDAEKAIYDVPIATYRAAAKAQGDKKETIKDDAGKDQQTYDSLNYRDDQFDLCDALIAICRSQTEGRKPYNIQERTCGTIHINQSRVLFCNICK